VDFFVFFFCVYVNWRRHDEKNVEIVREWENQNLGGHVLLMESKNGSNLVAMEEVQERRIRGKKWEVKGGTRGYMKWKKIL
jgi:hypothetical protein